MSWIGVVGMTLLLMIAVGSFVWFGWALVQNFVVVIRLRTGVQDSGDEVEETVADSDAEAVS